VAADVLLPGDPARAMVLAQQLTVKPLMTNHARGLWGYTGVTEGGDKLTVQSTGIGGPSAALVFTELAGLGVRRAIRVGTCGALDPELALGELISASEALADDGTSRRLGAGETAAPDPELTAALVSAGAPARKIVTTDLFYEVDDGRFEAWSTQGAAAIEMEAATLFTLGQRLGVAVACLLIVTDVFGPNDERRRISDEALAEAVERMGSMAAAALATR